jgi:hypothetical protein
MTRLGEMLRRMFRWRRGSTAIERVAPHAEYDSEQLRPPYADIGVPPADSIIPGVGRMRQITTEERLHVISEVEELSVRREELLGVAPDGTYVTDVRGIQPTDALGQQHGYGSTYCARCGRLFAAASLVECMAHHQPICRGCAVWHQGVPLCIQGVRDLGRLRLWDRILGRKRDRGPTN